jgi:chloride channel 3/4/5
MMSLFFALGVVIGINAAFIAICTEWLSDIKLGHCSYAWWLNQKFCCWGVESEGTYPNESAVVSLFGKYEWFSNLSFLLTMPS